jgi:GNAT superfamily N-acetyltransferase
VNAPEHHLIRPLTIEEWATYRDLRLAAFHESSGAFSESFEDEQSLPREHFETCIGRDPEHVTLGGFAGTALVAIATLKRDKRSKARHKAFVHTMYVAPEARRRGLAEALLRELVAIARGMAALSQLHLWVLDPEASGARRLYLKVGFVAQGPVVRDDLVIDGKHVDAEYMVLRL